MRDPKIKQRVVQELNGLTKARKFKKTTFHESVETKKTLQISENRKIHFFYSFWVLLNNNEKNLFYLVKQVSQLKKSSCPRLH